jgi:hypothetical protein
MFYLPGTFPVIAVAPHFFEHWRNGRFKWSEPESGYIAIALFRLFGFHVLVTNGLQSQDANYDKDCILKDKLRAILEHERNQGRPIALVLNLHMCSKEHSLAFALGTNDGKTIMGQNHLLEAVAKSLRKISSDELVIVNPADKLAARNKFNLSRFSQEELNTPSIQIEMSENFKHNWFNCAKELGEYLQVAISNKQI